MSNLSLKIINPINFKIIENILADEELEEESKSERKLWSYSYIKEINEESFRRFLYVGFISKDYMEIFMILIILK